MKGKFLKSIMTLTVGSLIAQIITVICSPILTRLYTESDLGLHAYILSISNIFAAIINGRYDMSIVTEEKNERVFAIVKLSFMICTISSVIISVGYGIFFYFSADKSQYTYTVLFLFLILFAQGIINILNSYNNRNNEYKILSKFYMIRTSFQNIGGVIAGIFRPGFLGLLIPYCFGQYFGIQKQSKPIRQDLKEIKEIRKPAMLEVAKLHKKQPLFSAPALLVNSLSYSIITLLAESLFGMGTIGYYSLSTRILGLPLSIIGGNISKVFFQEASREFEKTGNFKNSFNKTFLFLFSISIPMVLCMYFLAPWACNVFFGAGWETAGSYIRILAIMFGFHFLTAALSPAMQVCKRQGTEFILQSFLLLSAVLSYIITRLQPEPTMEIFLTCVCILKSIGFFIYTFVIFIFSRKNLKEEY